MVEQLRRRQARSAHPGVDRLRRAPHAGGPRAVPGGHLPRRVHHRRRRLRGGPDASTSLSPSPWPTARSMVDFSGTSPQSGGAINSSFSQTLSGMVYAVRCLVDPSIPMNEGCFRVVTHGPAGGGHREPRARPRRAAGESSASRPRSRPSCGRWSRRDPGPGSRLERRSSTSTRSPASARTGKPLGEPRLRVRRHRRASGSDGPDATGGYFLGGRCVIPQVEPLEAQHPFVADRCRLRRRLRGAGQWRGGLGVELVIRMLGATELTVRGDRIGIPPPGHARGGLRRGGRIPGRAGRRHDRRAAYKRRGSGSRRGTCS